MKCRKPPRPTNNTDQPITSHYGAIKSVRLSREETRVASFDERFTSIGRYIVSLVYRFYSTLSPEGRVTYSVDDIFNELWVELREKNEHYESSDGSYSAFAGRLIHHKLLELRECSRCVRMPMNVCCDFKKYNKAEAAGLLTPAQKSLMLQILAAGRDHGAIKVGRHNTNDDAGYEAIDESELPPAELERQEQEDATTAALAAKLATLTVLECVCLGASMELWGQDKMTSPEVAARYGHSDKFMRSTLRSARRKLGVRAR